MWIGNSTITGKIRYKITDELASYSSMKTATIGKRRWGFAFCRGGLVGFEPATGGFGIGIADEKDGVSFIADDGATNARPAADFFFFVAAMIYASRGVERCPCSMRL